jgi:hypothetical protein
MKRGDLVWAEVHGVKHMCVIERLEPNYPDPYREGTTDDWYFVLPVTDGVSRAWVRGHKMEVISEGRRFD